MGAGALSNLIRSLRLPTSPQLLVGLDVSDDAAVYQINQQQALVQTVDFFPPIVDDPYSFGAIAAANALSDVYAMGGKPILALAIAGFPRDLPPSIIQAIMQGGADKVAEAGAVLAGGHTIIDNEPKYGLCVTGLIDPALITRKAQAQAGDQLYLTKALGTGVISTASKRQVGDPADLELAIESMLRLNRRAAEHIAAAGSIRSATDITGFGLLGHGLELARNSQVGLRINSQALPLLQGAYRYAQAGIMPGGLHTNRAYVEQQIQVNYSETVDPALQALLYDPQTSGGLLIAVAAEHAVVLEQQFAQAGDQLWPIGEIIEQHLIEVI